MRKITAITLLLAFSAQGAVWRIDQEGEKTEPSSRSVVKTTSTYRIREKEMRVDSSGGGSAGGFDIVRGSERFACIAETKTCVKYESGPIGASMPGAVDFKIKKLSIKPAGPDKKIHGVSCKPYQVSLEMGGLVAAPGGITVQATSNTLTKGCYTKDAGYGSIVQQGLDGMPGLTSRLEKTVALDDVKRWLGLGLLLEGESTVTTHLFGAGLPPTTGFKMATGTKIKTISIKQEEFGDFLPKDYKIEISREQASSPARPPSKAPAKSNAK